VQELEGRDPRQIGRYRILGRLGVGGMGVVYLADTPGRIRVAIKCVHPHLAADNDFRRRFAREVAATRTVEGLCTARVIDADPDAPMPYLVMEYVDGPALDDEIARNGPLSDERVFGVAAGLAEALTSIHAAGVSHRDLKPGNVLLAPNGPKVVDFGISAALGLSTMTQPGTMLGTPAWLAPEHVNEGHIGYPTDIFSWAGIVVFAATGHPPFGEVSRDVYVARLLHGEPDISGVPLALQEPVAAAFNRDPALRPTASELLATLTGTSDLFTEDTTVMPGPDVAPTAAMPAQPAASEPAAPPAPVAPLPATSASSPPPQPRTAVARRSRAPWVIAAVVTAALVAAGLAIALSRSSDSNRHNAGRHATGKATSSKSNSPTASASASPTKTIHRQATNGYITYSQPQFGMSDEVPADLTVVSHPSSAPPGSKGKVFATPDGTAAMTLIARPNDGQSVYDVRRQLRALARSESAQVTYFPPANSGVAAISGHSSDGSSVFYERDVVTSGVIYSLSWRYPTAEQSTYETQVNHTAQTFSPNPAPAS
jgi:serine/threonine protein kinase